MVKFLAEDKALLSQLAPGQDIDPTQITITAQTVLSWECERGHVWRTKVAYRARGSACHYCTKQKPWPGESDLATLRPDLTAEWHPEKNEVLPSEVSPSSNKKAWWIGTCGHEWEAKIANRHHNRGCPICSGRQVLAGFNDLVTTHPDLAFEFYPDRNPDDISPSKLTAGSNRMVVWRCPRGHAYQAKVAKRAAGTGCPICAHRLVLNGQNDLATTHPQLAQEFATDLNGGVSASGIVWGSPFFYWWRCDKGHTWRTSPNIRVRQGTGCAVCNGRRAGDHENLTGTHPEIAQFFSKTLNEPLRAENLVGGSNRKVWWTCNLGHNFLAAPRYLTLRGQWCPICSNHQVLSGFNDLEAVNPELALEWHPTRNGYLEPTAIVAGSNKKVWWKCSEGHEWRATVASRASVGCGSCAARGGYHAGDPGIFYLLRHSQFDAFKVGITNQDTRHNRLEKLRAAGFAIVKTWESETGQLLRDLEDAALRLVRVEMGLGPYFGREEMSATGGWTETFSGADIKEPELIKWVEDKFQEIKTDYARTPKTRENQTG